MVSPVGQRYHAKSLSARMTSTTYAGFSLQPMGSTKFLRPHQSSAHSSDNGAGRTGEQTVGVQQLSSRGARMCARYLATAQGSLVKRTLI